MQETEFQSRSGEVFAQLLRTFDALDPDIVEAETQAGVLTIAFANGTKLVLNTQRPTRQIWMAGQGRAWHFVYDGLRWVDTKDARLELFAAIAQFARKQDVEIAI